MTVIKTDCYDITEILLKVALNTHKPDRQITLVKHEILEATVGDVVVVIVW